MKYILAILFPAIGLMIGSLAIPFGIFIGVFSYFFVSHMTETNDFPPMASTSDSASDSERSDTTPDNDQDDLFESDTIERTLFSQNTTTFDDNEINPATGLPMIGGIGGVDVEGNPFGIGSSDSFDNTSLFDDSISSLSDDSMNSSLFDDSTNSCFDDSSLFDDDGFGCGSSSFDDPFS
ncbi:hypothetical protein [Vibrio splendidus]|uniref:hypothetical protein n=1 Tax=Vibrio splendidus TaxID=29497 RepID=UPI0007F95AAA|nr:hypothetical protein [Vibrio splendidus]OBT31674.1 hypothetical protein A9262_05750 [Vibrio splendidus]